VYAQLPPLMPRRPSLPKDPSQRAKALLDMAIKQVREIVWTSAQFLCDHEEDDMHMFCGARSQLLHCQAYEEEGIKCPDVDERHTPVKLLYPRSYVDAVSRMPGDKMHDYCFMGGLYLPETYQHRAWIIEYARQRFTDRSYFLVTDNKVEHAQLGRFDYTHIERDVFMPKEVPPQDRGFFHARFFRMLRSSQFALCPAGDQPWSMRFFEAIMCRSIPIVSDREHVGRHELERSIGYHVYLPEDRHIYDYGLVEENFNTFLRHQTLIEPGRIHTTHGTVFYIDEATKELRHGPLAQCPANVFFVFDGSGGRLVFRSPTSSNGIVCFSDHSQSIIRSENDPFQPKPTAFELVPILPHSAPDQRPDNPVGLRANNLYLSAEADGRVTLNRANCLAWEHFRIIRPLI
jgi:hypothetical protein